MSIKQLEFLFLYGDGQNFLMWLNAHYRFVTILSTSYPATLMESSGISVYSSCNNIMSAIMSIYLVYFFFFSGLGRMPIVLQMIPSITSSAPPPMEVRRRSL